MTKTAVERKGSETSSHTHHAAPSSMGLWMLVDGIGLAVVAGATIMEGIHLWKEFYHSYWETEALCLLFWFGGRTLQVVGLTFLIAFAASFQMFPVIEQFGMLLISSGPILNMVSCFLFVGTGDPLYKLQWYSTEIVELLGMIVLDISMIHMEEIYVLTAELSGFFVLSCAAILQFMYAPGAIIPVITTRADTVHSSECFGLLLLSVVAVAQYQMKVHKQERKKRKQLTKNGLNSNTSNSAHSTHSAHDHLSSPDSIAAYDVESGNVFTSIVGNMHKSSIARPKSVPVIV